MSKFVKYTIIGLVILTVEIGREWVTLRSLGFEPDRFAQWLRGCDDVKE